MRFFPIFTTFGLVALAAAQNATITDADSTAVSSTVAPASTASVNAQVRCLQQCGSADVCCQAKCVGVPCPSQLQANATTECAAQCPQGNGTASETEEYADCQASCISSYFLTASSTAAPTATADQSSGSTTASFGSEPTATDASTTEGSAATGASGSAAPSETSSDNGADQLHVGTVGLGFLVLVMAGLAL